jgi:hypothetical protein
MNTGHSINPFPGIDHPLFKRSPEMRSEKIRFRLVAIGFLFTLFLSLSATLFGDGEVPEPTEAKDLPASLRPSEGHFVPVTRDEALEIADRYLHHAWRPSAKNVMHGDDGNGVRVDTPDAGFSPGWWKPDGTKIGLPYKWGGFSSIEEFDLGLASGKYAGDSWTDAREKMPDGGPASDKAVGVDCSGFVSRCWKLPEQYNTRQLPELSDSLPDISSLKRGDLIDKPGVHCLLFKEFTNSAKTKAIMYQSGSPYPSREASSDRGRVRQVEIDLQELYGLGFRPYRLKWMKD